MWTFPIPSEDQLVHDYETSYVLHHHDALPPHYMSHKEARAAAQRQFVLQHADLSIFERASVLDIGCGIGSLIKAFADLPNIGELVGIEPSAVMRARANAIVPPGTRLMDGVFAPERFVGESFALVTASHVLEHLADPVGFLSGVRSTTRPNGFVFLEVPRQTEAEVRRIVAARRPGLMHLLFFERETVLEALRSAGWEVWHVAAFGPSRDSFSVVPPARSRKGSRARRQAARIARRLGLPRLRGGDAVPRGSTPPRIGSPEVFFTENDPDGIWLRVLAQNPAR